MSDNQNLKKVSIIGAGNVGSTCAFLLAINSKAHIFLFDKFGDLAKAKALDIGHSAVAFKSKSSIVAPDDYRELKGSRVVIITAGFPRKPGMSRADLVKTNAQIATELAAKIKEHAPDAVVIVVSNPLDILTYLVLKETGFERSRVFGMAGLVDDSRFKYFAAKEAGINSSDIKSHVLGLHANEMIIPKEEVWFGEKNCLEKISEEQFEQVKENTRSAGAQIVGLLKNGSAYYMPGSGAYLMARAVLDDTNEEFDASVLLKGEYGIEDACIGVPISVGSSGASIAPKLSLSDEAKEELKNNALVFKEQLQMI